MGDLSLTDASQAVIIVGSDTDGTETVPVGSTAYDEKTGLNAYVINPTTAYISGISVGGVQGNIVVGVTAVKAQVGISVYSGRKVLTVTPTNGIIYWGYTNAVTTSTGTPIFTNQMATFEIEDSAAVWLIASANRDVRITEGA